MAKKILVRKDRKTKKFMVNLRMVGGGNQHFATAEEAAAVYDQAIADIRNGTFVKTTNSPKVQTIALGFFCEEYLKRDIKPKQKDRVEGQLTKIMNFKFPDKKDVQKDLLYDFPSSLSGKRIGDVKIVELTAERLQLWIIGQMFDPKKGAWETSRKLFVVLGQLFDYAMLKKLAVMNPMNIIKKPRPSVDETFNITQNRQKIASLSQDKIIKVGIAMSPKYVLAYETAYKTGIRSAELRALKWSEVNLQPGQESVFITHGADQGGQIGRLKTEAALRLIPLEKELAQNLREWKLNQPPGQRLNNLVFPEKYGNAAGSFNLLRKGLYPACDRAGVERFRWHDLRHYYASKLVYNTSLSDDEICYLMGHSDVAVTRRVYKHWLMDPKRDNRIHNEIAVAFK